MNREVILLVEDDHHVGQSINDYLEAQGFAVVWVQDGISAVREAWNPEVGLIILDVFLPGQDGIGVCQAVKEGPTPPKIILMSAANMAEELKAALPAEKQPERFFVKPVPLAKLLAEVRELLGQEVAPALKVTPRPEVEQTTPPPTVSFPQLLVRYEKLSHTGALEIVAEGVRTRIQFLHGSPAFVEGGALEDTLGRLLLRRGKISEEQYRQAIELMRQRVDINEHVRFGEVLIELGFVEPQQVYEALSEQVRQKLIACFQWERFHHTFTPATGYPEDLPKLEAPQIDQLILEGLELHVLDERLDATLEPYRGRFPMLVSDVSELGRRLRLSEPEQRFLVQMSGERRLSQMLKASSLGEPRTSHLMATMLITGAVTAADKPAQSLVRTRLEVPREPRRAAAAPVGIREDIIREYVRTKGSPDHEVLRVSRDATPDEVDEAFNRVAKPWAPEEIAKQKVGALHDKAVEIYAAMRRARRRLKGTPTPVEGLGVPRAKRDSLDAELAFRKGKDFMRKSMLGGALREFEVAAKLRPDETEYRMFAAWARYLASKDDQRRVSARKDALDLSVTLLHQNRMHGKAHFIVGHFLKLEGQDDKAGRHFRLAAKNDPEDIEAQREARLFERRSGKLPKVK